MSVIVPVRNEERHIETCLGAVLTQDYPLERIEVLVVDGGSNDRSRARATAVLERAGLARWRVVENRVGTRPANLNAGLAASRGEIVCRVDARSVLRPAHVRRSVELLVRMPEVVAVGGAQVPTTGAGAGGWARGVVRALRNPYVMGFARYRRGAGAGPADTVYLGSYRRRDLVAVGGWSEHLLVNEDFELAQRLRRVGVVWFCPDLSVDYRPREDPLELLRQYRTFGRWKAAGWLEGAVPVGRRHAALLAGAPLAAAALAGVARRSPVAAVAAVAATVVVSDRMANGRARASDGVAAVGASMLVAGAWWGGLAEQAVRFIAFGERLIGPAATRRSPAASLPPLPS